MSQRTPEKPRIGDVPPTRILCAIRSLTSAASAPISADALVRHVGRKLGYSRTGRRVRAAITVQLKIAEGRHVISRSGTLVSTDYISINDYTIADLQECVMTVVTREPMDRADVIVNAARALGFSRTGGQIEERFKSAINGLIRRKLVKGDTAHVWRAAARRRSGLPR